MNQDQPLRVAYDRDGDRWNELEENGQRTGWFKHQRPDDGDGDELMLDQILAMYGIECLVPAADVAELERVEASRRDWAEEAMFSPRRREPRPSPDEVRPCSCLTSEGAAQVAADPRWSLPQCSVHPGGGEGDG